MGRRVLDQSKGTIPKDVWDRTFDVDGTLLTVLIGAAEVSIRTESTNKI